MNTNPSFPAITIGGKEGKMTRWYVRDWFEYEAVKNNNAYSLDIHDGLEEAVKRQLMSDVPTAYFFPAVWTVPSSLPLPRNMQANG